MLEFHKVTMPWTRELRSLINTEQGWEQGKEAGSRSVQEVRGQCLATGGWPRKWPAVRCQPTLRLQAWERCTDFPYCDNLYFLQCALLPEAFTDSEQLTNTPV